MGPRAECTSLAAEIVALPRPLLIALDVDGTLAPIVEDPARAMVPAEIRETLGALSAREGICIALVTGRDAAQLERMIPLDGVWRVVEHGRRILRPGEIATPAPADARGLARLLRFLRWARAEVEPRGGRIEEKEGAVVVHVRELAARDASAALALMSDARAIAEREGLFAREGRAVLEAQIEPADKGRALEALIARTGAASCVYAGDDLTDEPAIRIASEHGLGIFVRSAERAVVPEGARAVLEGPDDVARVIAELGARL